MVWVGLSIYGSTGPYFVEQGESINTATYCNKILPFAKREANRLFGERKFVFQQDGAPAHTSAKSQTWCERNFGRFIRKTEWPPNSPDLNPLDYYYWDAVVTRIETKNLRSKEDLRREIEIAMEKVPYWDIVKAISRFNMRVREVENREGNNIMNKFK